MTVTVLYLRVGELWTVSAAVKVRLNEVAWALTNADSTTLWLENAIWPTGPLTQATVASTWNEAHLHYVICTSSTKSVTNVLLWIMTGVRGLTSESLAVIPYAITSTEVFSHSANINFSTCFGLIVRRDYCWSPVCCCLDLARKCQQK